MLWFIVGWLLGIFIGAFFLIQPLVILFFGFRNVVNMKNIGALALESRANVLHTISLIILSALFTASCYLVGMLNHDIEVGFYVGVGINVLFGLKGVFNNKTNRAEFIEKNINFINPEFLTEYTKNLYETEKDPKWLNAHIDKLESRSGIRLKLINVDALVLDPLHDNPYTENWIVGKDITYEQADEFYDNNDQMLYILRFYENGDQKEMLVSKEYFYKSLHDMKKIVDEVAVNFENN